MVLKYEYYENRKKKKKEGKMTPVNSEDISRIMADRPKNDVI